MNWSRVARDFGAALRPVPALLTDWLPDRQPWRALLAPVGLLVLLVGLYLAGILVVLVLGAVGGPELVVSGDRRYGRDDAVFVGVGAAVLVLGYVAVVVWDVIGREWRLSRDLRRYRGQ